MFRKILIVLGLRRQREFRDAWEYACSTGTIDVARLHAEFGSDYGKGY